MLLQKEVTNKTMTINLTFKDLWEIKSRITAQRDLFLTRVKQGINVSDFCPLYTQNKTCHDIALSKINCQGCYCPNYMIEVALDNHSGLYKIGICSINSKFGIYKQKENYLILNCSQCKIPHYENFSDNPSFRHRHKV